MNLKTVMYVVFGLLVVLLSAKLFLMLLGFIMANILWILALGAVYYLWKSRHKVAAFFHPKKDDRIIVQENESAVNRSSSAGSHGNSSPLDSHH